MNGVPRTRVYRRDRLEAKDLPISEVSECLDQDDTMVWIDLCGPTVEELRHLADELGVHELAVEDALGRHQRPKLDRYPTHNFLACHAVAVDSDTATVRITEIDLIFADRWVITVRKDDGLDVDEVAERAERIVDLAGGGVAFVVYSVLDVVLDGYFDATEVIDEFFDDMSSSIFDERPLTPDEQQRWFRMRQALIRFHRTAFPLREAIGSLVRRETEVVTADLHPYFQDLYDHVLRITDSTDALRDLAATIVETNLSLRDYRQNQVMKKVTSWAAIIAVPTLVTGFYGMNVKYPGVATVWGTWVSVAVMLVASLALYLGFRRRDWL